MATNRISTIWIDITSAQGSDRVSSMYTEVVLQPLPTNRISDIYNEIVTNMPTQHVSNRISDFYLEFISGPAPVIPTMKPYAMILG